MHCILKGEKMFSFIKNGNSVSLCENGKEILSNMNVWINSNVAKTNWKHEIIAEPEVKLELVNAEDDIAYFECKGNAKIVLSLSEENGCFAIKATGKYKPSSSTYGSHIDICNGIHIDFNMPHTGNFVSGYIRYVFWQEPFIGKELTSLKPRTQALLLQNDKYEYFLTAADKAFKSELFSANEGNRVSLMIHANAILDDIDEFVLFGGTSEEQYLLEENVT